VEALGGIAGSRYPRPGTVPPARWVRRLSRARPPPPTFASMRRTAVVTALLAALLAAAPAEASRRGDRADARALARATKDVRAAVASHFPEAEQAASRLQSEPCKSALDAVPEGDASIAALELVFGYGYAAGLAPAGDDLRRFEEALYSVRLRDPVLKSGRAAWRRELRAAYRMQPPPEDICARLDAWRQGGYAPEQAPVLGDPGVEALFAQGKGVERKMSRAGRRLRKLGVKPAVAKLWNGIGFLLSG
jgi:hypothetical protein